MRLGFSTLGCPRWTLAEACAQATFLGYHGIELRLLDGRLFTAPLPEAQRIRVADVLAGSGLAVSALASSVCLAAVDAEATSAELHALMELAAAWSAPMVRVFGGKISPGEPRRAAVRRAAELVAEALPDAARLGVRVGLETHDDFSAATHAAALLDAVGDQCFVAIWDLQHTWRAGDQPRHAWAALGPHVAEIQVKDGQPAPDGRWRQALLGDGVIPVRECLEVALQDGFDSWLVVEWEKHWQPDLDEPEVALPAHQRAISAMLAELAGRRG